MIRVGIPPLKSMAHIVVGVPDLFKEILNCKHPKIEFIETEDLEDPNLQYYLSFGYGNPPSKIFRRNPEIKFI